TATLLATRAPVLLCPAMHTEMWEHAAVQANLATPAGRGVPVLSPQRGPAHPERIVARALALLDLPTGPLAGRRVLVTAGGTREPIDPVRYLGNRSSGRMGIALAEAAARRGAGGRLIAATA